MKTPLLELRGLRAGYGEAPVLFGVDLAIHAGEIVTLVGSNGAGKTTLLRAVSRVLASQGMTILVIEHVMRAIRNLSDRLLVLHHGQQIAEGSPQQVLEDPRVVEAYLGKRRA